MEVNFFRKGEILGDQGKADVEQIQHAQNVVEARWREEKKIMLGQSHAETNVKDWIASDAGLVERIHK